jgi:phospholipid-binding lipoprotein MlaA
VVGVSGVNVFCAESYNYDIYDSENEETHADKTVIKDPFEKFSRKMLDFDLFMLDTVVSPFLRGYRRVVPSFVRTMIYNLGNRIADVSTLIYSMAILDYRNSALTIGTFSINMTIGLLGLFDPATKLGVTRTETSLGDVLSYYDVSEGFYMVLPFVGPTTLTDSFGSIGNVFIDPLKYNGLALGGTKHSWTPNDTSAPKLFVEYIDSVDKADKLNENFVKKSFDPYTFIKNSYIENKNYRINMRKNRR